MKIESSLLPDCEVLKLHRGE